MKEEQADILVDKFRSRFDQSVTAMDAETASRITRARYSALEQKRSTGPVRSYWLPAGAVATACLGMLVYSLVPQTGMEEKTFVDEIEIISELDLYENLEFYEWLEQHEIPS
jgi:hypothetical protein